MTALTIVQEAAAWLALPVPDVLFGSTDPQTVQLRNLLNEEGYELATWPDKAWTKLTKQKTFTTVATDDQPGALASDFARFCDGSIWDRTMDRPVWGPMTPQQWQQEKAGPTFTTMYYGFRLRGNDWLMTPTPTAGDEIAYEYVSNLYVYASGDTVPTKSAFSDDTDTSIFPETLVARRRPVAVPSRQGLPLCAGIRALDRAATAHGRARRRHADAQREPQLPVDSPVAVHSGRQFPRELGRGLRGPALCQ